MYKANAKTLTKKNIVSIFFKMLLNKEIVANVTLFMEKKYSKEEKFKQIGLPEK